MITISNGKLLLKYLNLNYPSMKLNFADDLTVQVWIRPFVNLDPNEFKDLIIKYCDENKFPPTNPLDLKKPLFQAFEDKDLTPYQAYCKLVNTLVEYDFVRRPKTASKHIFNEAIKKAYLELENDFAIIGENIGNPEVDKYARQKFMELYSKYKSLETENKVNNYLTYDRSKLAISNGDGNKSQSIEEEHKEFLKLCDELLGG